MMWFNLSVNPEPWAIGPVGSARRGGKLTSYVGRNAQLYAYQQAVKEAITEQLPERHIILNNGIPIMLRMYFWRQRAEYETAQARTHRKHEADLTNLQKATEDALQGVILVNDKDVKAIHSVMVEQGPDVVGRIVIAVEMMGNPMRDKILGKIPSRFLERPVATSASKPAFTQQTLPYDNDIDEVF